jgi:hypothetical protein
MLAIIGDAAESRQRVSDGDKRVRPRYGRSRIVISDVSIPFVAAALHL